MDTEDKGFSESAQAALGSGTNRFYVYCLTDLKKAKYCISVQAVATVFSNLTISTHLRQKPYPNAASSDALSWPIT